MSRRSKGLDISGWLILDKGQGMTSTQAVGAVKRLFQARKAGHAGTLDPLATGILPIALGEATKTVPFVVGGEKAYRFTVKWGEERNTDDADGEVVRTSPDRPSCAKIEEVAARFVGEILQTPPQFSAVKIDGERAYDLAREGEEVEIEARAVSILRLALAAMPDADTSVFEAECGKGTYVRALARDMGRMLGCYGYVSELRRTRVGPFDAASAVALSALEQAFESGGPQACLGFLKPVEAGLEDLAVVPVNSSDASRLKRGQPVLLRGRDAPIMSGPAYAVSRGQLVAIGEIERGELRPTRVFNIASLPREPGNRPQ
jgi:tRNA pseudouridine55 synthase